MSNFKPPQLKLTRDMPAYMRTKNRERRERAKRLGICRSCNSDPVKPGRTKCEQCMNLR
jgi:hypothetical protein